MQRRTVAGPFTTRRVGSGVWQLSAGGAPSADIYLWGAAPQASEALQGPGIASLAIEWHAGGAEVMLTGAHAVRRLSVAGATIHEPQGRLYESLPLASFDTAAKRFWRRVFRLMRLPGGRLFLRFIARRNRAANN